MSPIGSQLLMQAPAGASVSDIRLSREHTP
jgi:hypothetical protein